MLRRGLWAGCGQEDSGPFYGSLCELIAAGKHCLLAVVVATRVGEVTMSHTPGDPS
jgi:hypothetical protein